MVRQTFLLICSALAFSVSLFNFNESTYANESKPNIVYILLDDAGYGDLSCYGQKKFETPNIDRLAAEGMRFTDHYAGCTVCAPTRCSLMTGLHTGHTFVRGNREVKPEGQYPIPADAVTIPRLLQKAGYSTGMFGKWGLGSPGSHADPMEHFDRFYGYNCQREAHNYYPEHLWSDREKVKLDGKTYSSDLIMAEANSFIRNCKQNAQPFFCFLSVTVPHAAMHVPEDSAAPFRKKFPQFEDRIGKYKGPLVRNPAAGFAGMMSRLDNQIGELMNLLKELKIDEETIVLLSSDNGPHKEGGHMPEFFDSNGPLRGIKRDLYEGGIRVPLIARWPGKIKASTTSDLPSAHWDMLATFCELAESKIPENIDGVSVLPTLLGESSKQTKHEYLYWEFPPRQTQAVRMGKWKAVRFLKKDKRNDRRIELFDLSKDVGEQNDIAASHPDVVKQITEIMKKSHKPSKLFPLDIQ